MVQNALRNSIRDFFCQVKITSRSDWQKRNSLNQNNPPIDSTIQIFRILESRSIANANQMQIQSDYCVLLKLKINKKLYMLYYWKMNENCAYQRSGIYSKSVLHISFLIIFINYIHSITIFHVFVNILFIGVFCGLSGWRLSFS